MYDKNIDPHAESVKPILRKLSAAALCAFNSGTVEDLREARFQAGRLLARLGRLEVAEYNRKAEATLAQISRIVGVDAISYPDCKGRG